MSQNINVPMTITSMVWIVFRMRQTSHSLPYMYTFQQTTSREMWQTNALGKNSLGFFFCLKLKPSIRQGDVFSQTHFRGYPSRRSCSPVDCGVLLFRDWAKKTATSWMIRLRGSRRIRSQPGAAWSQKQWPELWFRPSRGCWTHCPSSSARRRSCRRSGRTLAPSGSAGVECIALGVASASSEAPGDGLRGVLADSLGLGLFCPMPERTPTTGKQLSKCC